MYGKLLQKNASTSGQELGVKKEPRRLYKYQTGGKKVFLPFKLLVSVSNEQKTKVFDIESAMALVTKNPSRPL